MNQTKIRSVNYIVYHGGCPDGIVGAWALSTHYPTARLLGWKHQDPLPMIDGIVIFVDICPKYEVIIDLLLRPNIQKLIILDHHKSAERDLARLTYSNKLQIIFDMNRSGCRIAWDYVNKTGPPWWLLVVEAGDLWRHSTIPYCKELLSALHFYEYLSSVDKVRQLANQNPDFNVLLATGQILNEYRAQATKRYAKNYTIMTLTNPKNHNQTYQVAVGQSSLDLRSEVGNLISEKEKDNCAFAAIVTFDPETDNIWLSLRANESSTCDLSLISKEIFGGGGHPKSAGATIPRSDWLKYFNVSTIDSE